MKKTILLIALLASTLTTWAQTEKYDLNGDGKVNVADVTVLVDYILILQNPGGATDDDPNSGSNALVGTWTKTTNGGVIGIKFTADGKAYYNEWNVGDQPNFDNVKSPAQVTITTTTIKITHTQVPDYFEEYSYILSDDGKSATFTLINWNKNNHGLNGTFTKTDSPNPGSGGTTNNDDSNVSSDALVGTWTKTTNGDVIGIKFTADGKAYYNEWSVGVQPNFDNIKSPAEVTITTNSIRITHSQVSGYYEEYSYILSNDGNSVTFTLVSWNKDNHGLNGTFTKADSPNSMEDNQAMGKAPVGVIAVDLGLPSGTKWANMNVGAQKPEDYGLYFAWGETTGYAAGTSHSFDWDSYKWYNGSINIKYGDTVDNKNILDPEDDAAHFNWGGLWYMPTGEDVKELQKNTTSKWTTVNGVYGRKLTSKVEGYTDKSIFLPATGYRRDSSLYNQGSIGYFWSSTLSNDKDASHLVTVFRINSNDDVRRLNWGRINGITVRPVLKN